MFVLFSAVGRFAGNGYVSADIVHIFRLFLSVGISLILLFSAVCCCLFFESFAVGVLCGCCVFGGGLQPNLVGLWFIVL